MERKLSVDTLDEMFEEQDRFMKLLQKERNFVNYPVELETKSGQKIVKDISHECLHELFEAIHLLTDSKDHRKTVTGTFDREKFLEELSDALHYYIEICILCGIKSKELYSAFMKKSEINFNRINNGY